MMKPACAPWNAFASYVFKKRYLSGAFLQFLQPDRENAVLESVMAWKTKNQHVNRGPRLAGCDMVGAFIILKEPLQNF